MDFLTDGRSVVNFREAQVFLEHTKQRGEEYFYICLEKDQLKHQTIAKISKCFLKANNAVSKVGSNPWVVITEESKKLGYNYDSSLNGLCILTSDNSEDFKQVINNGNERQMAMDQFNLLDGGNAPIYIDMIIVRRFFTNKDVIAKTGSVPLKRCGLDDTVFESQQNLTKKLSCSSFEVDLDRESESFLSIINDIRDTAEFLATGEELEENFGTLESKITDASAMSVKICQAIRTITRETQGEIISAQSRLDRIVKQKQDLEQELEEASINNTTEIDNLKTLVQNLQAKQSFSDFESTNATNEIRLNLQKKEDQLAEVKETHKDTVKKLHSEIKEKESTIEEHDGQIKNFKEKIQQLEHQKSTTQMDVQHVKQQGRQLKLSVTSSTNSRKRSSPYKGPVIKMEWSESSDDEPEISKPNNVGSSLIMTGQPVATNALLAVNPLKFGMPKWDPNSIGFLEHLLRLEPGINLATKKNMEQKEIEHLILMTLPSEYLYVSEFYPED